MTQVKSDGGSSSYYEINLPPHVVQEVFKEVELDGGDLAYFKIEVKDVIKYALDNDFDRGNIFKALVRLGHKHGADELYDLRKCKFFIEEMIKDYEETL